MPNLSVTVREGLARPPSGDHRRRSPRIKPAPATTGKATDVVGVPMPAMRAKFKLVKMSKSLATVKNPATGAWDLQVPVWDLDFTTVMDGSEENRSFFSASPSGQITVRTVNKGVVDALEADLDHTFYVDFTPAPR